MKVSVTIEKMRTVTILILAVAARAAEGETRAFLVSGGGSSYYSLYAEDEAGTHFTKVGPADSAGYHRYLWHDQGTWKIVYGKTFNKESNVVEYYIEGNQQQAPPTTGWKYHGVSGWSDVRVEQLPSLVSTLSQTYADRGSFTVDGGVLC